MKMRFNQAGKQRFSGQINDIGSGSDFCGFCVFDFLDNSIFQNYIGESAFKTSVNTGSSLAFLKIIMISSILCTFAVFLVPAGFKITIPED